MKKPKFYFNDEESEHCYDIDSFIEEMEDEGIHSKIIYEAKIVHNSGYIWCNYVSDLGVSSGCGKWCDDYKPRNGKGGICKHHSLPYECGARYVIELINGVYKLRRINHE